MSSKTERKFGLNLPGCHSLRQISICQTGGGELFSSSLAPRSTSSSAPSTSIFTNNFVPLKREPTAISKEVVGTTLLNFGFIPAQPDMSDAAGPPAPS